MVCGEGGRLPRFSVYRLLQSIMASLQAARGKQPHQLCWPCWFLKTLSHSRLHKRTSLDGTNDLEIDSAGIDIH